MHINLNQIVWNALKNNKSIFVSVGILLVGLFLEELLFPKIYSEFIIGLSDNQKTFDTKIILILLGIFVLAIIFFYISDEIELYSLPNIEMDVIKNVTQQVIESVKTEKTQLDINEFAINIKKINMMKSLIPIFNKHIAPTILISLGVTIYFSYYSPGLGFLTCALLIISIIILFKLGGSCFDDIATNENRMDSITNNITDMFNNINSVISSNMEKKELDKINKMINKINEDIPNARSCSNNNIIHSLIYFSILIILNAFAVKLYVDNKINLASLVSIFFIVLLLIQYYESLKYEIKYILQYVSMYDETKKYFSKFRISDKKLRDDLKIIKGDITLKNVNLKYENNYIFKNFNLNIKHKCTGIIGKVGTGKTSLLKLLADILPYEGDIFIDGQNLKDFSYESKMKHIIYIPQNPKLFNRSIYENLSYGTDFTFEQIEMWIKNNNLDNFINSFANGLKTIVGFDGTKVSTGQRHIISILRAIIQNKKIILFDEPTAALDNYHKKLFINLIKLMKDKLIIIVTHDDILHIFDEIIQFVNDNSASHNGVTAKIIKKKNN